MKRSDPPGRPDGGPGNPEPERLTARTATTLTRVLLLLYPPSFRKDAGNALVGDVRRRAKELASSQMGVVGFWLVRLTTSLLTNAVAAWGEELIPAWRRFPGRRRARSERIAGPGPSLRRRRSGAGSSTFSWLDLKLALRMLVKYPGLTLTGGLGIAVAMAIGVGFFAAIQSRFYPAIPLSEGDRLVGLQNWDLQTNREARRSLHDFDQWREEMTSVEDMAAFRTVARNVIAEDGSVELVAVAEITPSGFRLARVPPLLGRSLLEGDAAPKAPPVIVMGFDVWRSRFASAPDIVGSDLRLGRTVHTVVGVMPDGFAFPMNHRFWIPLRADPSDYERGEGPSLYISGRLAPGFDLADAQAELTVIGDRMAAAFPDTHGYFRAEVLPYTYMFAGMNSNAANAFWPLTVLASLLLVVVCVNVAILVYARTATRRGEIAVRSALGASRGRIVAQLFAESLVLSAGAAAVGLVIVKLGLDQVRSSMVAFEQPTFWGDYSVSGTALVYVVALTVLAAVITGVVPAVQATGRRVYSNLRQFNSRAGLDLGRTWTILIVVQVSVAVAALPIGVSIGWWQIRDFATLPAFPVDQFLFAQMTLEPEPPPGADADVYRRDLPTHFANLQTELSRRLEAEPAVVDHSFVLGIPGLGIPVRAAIENDPSAPGAQAGRQVQRSAVDLDFFRTFDVDVISGRLFRSGDRDENAADVVIVNRAFAGRLLGDGDALGRRIRYVPENPPDPSELGAERWHKVVGVVENIDANPFDDDLIKPRVYRPLKEVESSGAALLLRVRGIEHAALAGRVREIAAALDPTLQVDVFLLEEFYGVQRALLSTAAVALGVALLSVLLLSAAGIYALMSFTVGQRRREIAIRTALGAQSRRLLGGVFGKALRQVSLGVALGVGAALLLDGAAEGELLRGHGGALLTVMVMIMSVVGLVAALGPARRGLQVQPTEALKESD